MQDFSYKNNQLFIEDLNLNEVAATYGTPCYVYSKAAIIRAYQEYVSALGDHPGKVCYAVKANSNLAILQLLAQQGAGFDIVSEGELERVLRAGGSPDRVIFSGVGKTDREIKRALEVGIACFNVESEAELVQLNRVAEQCGIPANISIRINPDVDAKTHPYISTGLKENKFGIDITCATRTYEQAHAMSHLNIVGVDCHIGSQLTEIAPFLDALDRLLVLIDELESKGIRITHLDVGGGLGVKYQDETPPPVGELVDALKARLSGRALELIFEPGRSIVANAGVLLTEVIYLKPTEDKNFAIVDAAMNDNIRPSLYQAWQDIRLVNEASCDSEALKWDIVGPICETGDFLAKDRILSLQTRSKLALMSSGAYGFVMSSNYNSRPRAPEVLADGDTHVLIRERERFEDLILGEKLLPQSGE